MKINDIAIQEECTHLPTKCDYCELEYPRCDFDSHEEACGSRTEDCLRCGQKVMLSDMLKHESSGCKSHSTADQQQRVQNHHPRPSPIEQMMYQRRARHPPPSLLLPKIQNTDRSQRQQRYNGATNTRQAANNKPNKVTNNATSTVNGHQNPNRTTSRRSPPRPASPTAAQNSGKHSWGFFINCRHVMSFLFTYNIHLGSTQKLEKVAIIPLNKLIILQ